GLESHSFAGDAVAHVPLCGAERDHAVGIGHARLEVGRVLRLGKLLRERAERGAIERGGHRLPQRLMRPLLVVLELEPIERTLLSTEARTGWPGSLGFQGPMHA